MLAKVESLAVMGIEGVVLEIEVDVAQGLPTAVIVGLPDAAVRESRDRVKAALVNCSYSFPPRRITINLAPADIRKEGPAYDLPIAIGILIATEQLVFTRPGRLALIGELALDGAVRPVKGCLPMAIAAREAGIEAMIVPEANAAEAAVVDGVSVYGVSSVVDAVGFLSEKLDLPARTRKDSEESTDFLSEDELDLGDVKGQEHVKRALTIAAAGGHNVIMIGPPGSGQTMLARRLPSILPPLTLDQSLETTRVHSVSGQIKKGQGLLATRPFRMPHHTISDVGLVGGGSDIRPGELSLAHNGVLFLDELPEFRRRTLEVLRQPIEDAQITITRASGTATYPANVMLVCAMNPCPCGFYTDPKKSCHCTPMQIQRYLSRISGPLLDRIDIHIEVPALKYKELAAEETNRESPAIRETVSVCRKIQEKRFKRSSVSINALMSPKQIKANCGLKDGAEALLKQAVDEFGISARAYSRILKVGRTIADLNRSDEIAVEHIAEAIQYRMPHADVWE